MGVLRFIKSDMYGLMDPLYMTYFIQNKVSIQIFY